jgi:hypothetical protein
LTAERAALDDELATVRAEYEKRLKSAEEKRMALLEKVAALGGGVAEADALLEARRQKERDERVELLRRQIARRMLNAGLARGWSAWSEAHSARKHALTVMKLVGGRFKAPALAEAFNVWADECEAAHAAARAKAAVDKYRESAGALEGAAAELSEQMVELKAQMVAKLAAAEVEKKVALDRLRTELSGSADERMALRAEQEKEARIELLRRQVARRMLNAGVANAWSAWFDLWSAKTYAMNRLREVAAKLRSPELSTAFDVWVEMKQEAQMAQLAKNSASLEATVRQLRFANGQMDMVRLANEDELAALRSEVTELQATSAMLDASLRDLAAIKKEHEIVKLQASAAIEAEAEVRKQLEAAEADVERHQTADKELLEQLLTEQRKVRSKWLRSSTSRRTSAASARRTSAASARRTSARRTSTRHTSARRTSARRTSTRRSRA